MVQAMALLNNSDSDVFAAKGAKPISAKRVVGQVLGGVVLLLSGVAIGRQQQASSLRGSGLSLIGEAISSRAQFEAAYHAYTNGMTAASLSTTNTAIYSTTAPAGPTDLVALVTWYSDVGAGADRKWADQITNQAFVNAALPAASPAVPANKSAPQPTGCSTSISSYAEFGHCYSQATAGRPWAHITSVDDQVRGASLPSGISSSEITVLWSWYKQHASASEQHDFENTALVHKKSAGEV